MKFKSLLKASLTTIITFVLVLCTLTTFPSNVSAQTSFACQESDATAIQCLKDAISLQNDGGNSDDVKFFLNRAIEKVDVFALVAAKSRLAELEAEQGNEDKANQLIEEVKAIRKAVGLKASCPSCGACGECTVFGLPGEDSLFMCIVCPTP